MVVISFYLGCPFSHSAYNLSKTVRHGANPFSAQRWVCVLSGCVTQRTLSWNSEGVLRRGYRQAAQSGGERRSGKTTLNLHCLQPYSCPTPAISCSVWPPKACSPLSLPPSSSLQTSHSQGQSPYFSPTLPWTFPFLTEALYLPDVTTEFCLLPSPLFLLLLTKARGEGHPDKLPKFTALTDHLLNFYYLIIFLKPIHF